MSALPLWNYLERSELSPVVLGTSKDPNAKLTVVLLSARSGRPEVAVKAPTSDAAVRAVEHEAAVLRAVRSLELGDLEATIPRIRDFVDFDGRPAVVMSVVHGVPMTTAYMRGRHTARPARVAADFAAVGDWLERFHVATASGRSIALDMDGGVRRRLRERFPDEPLDGPLAYLSEIHAGLAEQSVPETAVHGDLWMGNVLTSGGRVSGVVDWEAAATRGPPVRDLARFAYMYALYLDRRTRPGRRVHGHAGLRAGSWGAGVRYALDGSGWFPDLFRGFLQDGLTRLGAASSSWRGVALAAIAEVAARTDDRAFAHCNLELFSALAGSSTQPEPAPSNGAAPSPQDAGISPEVARAVSR